MGIAKRLHQKIVEGVISKEKGERICNRLLTPPELYTRPAKGQ